MNWILGFVDPLIILNLRMYKITNDIWEYLLTTYNQENATKFF